MFEGLLHEALANSLGRLLDISREQLRISLWSAWRTGLTLENVGLRPDAFEHLQLPFTLESGRIGRIQAQVPWRALRSPVVVELQDVHIRISLRRDQDLTEGPSAERSWLAKQAELAAAELAAMAAASGGGEGGGGGRAAGVLWSFVQHVLATLVNRLQLSVRNVHVELEDPESGTRLGLQLRRLHTCRPGDAEHASLLLSDDAGIRAHASAAARGSIQKQFAVEGLALYWQPGPPGGAAPGSAAGQAAPAAGRVSPSPGRRRQAHRPRQQPGFEPSYLLLPTDLVVHSTLQLSAPTAPAAGAPGSAGDGSAGSGGGMRVHVAAVVHHLQLSLDGRQAGDMLQLADRLAWCTARNRHASYCPDGWRTPGPRAVPWRRVWRYAVSAVLHELRGDRQGRVPWADGPARVALRKQYVALYRCYLERRHLLEGGGAAASAAARRAVAEADEQLPALEQELSVDDILTCRHTAQRVLDAALAAASGMGEALEDKAVASGRSRGRSRTPLPASVVGGQTGGSVVGGGAGGGDKGGGGGGGMGGGAAAGPASLGAPSPARAAAASASAQRAPSLAASSSLAGTSVTGEGLAGGSVAGAAGGGGRRGYLAWGLSKAASLLRYIPYASSGEGGAGALPEPTEAELEELYKSVDFHPEEQQAAAAAAGRSGAAASGLHLSLDCLLSKASLLLLEAPAPAPAAGCVEGAAAGAAEEGAGGAAGAAGGAAGRGQGTAHAAGDASSSGGGGGGGGGIASLELEQLRLGVQVQPEQTTALLTVAGLGLHDMCSEGPGVSSPILFRGASGSAALATLAAGTPPAHFAASSSSSSSGDGYLPPAIKLHFTAPAAAGGGVPGSIGEAGGGREPRPQLDILVQPLLLHLRPLCAQRIVALVPPVVQGSLASFQQAAVNGLSAEARCAIKARQVAALGPPVSVLLKVVNLQVQLSSGDLKTSPGVVLHTGTIMLVSTDPQLVAPPPSPGQQQQQQQQWQARPLHVLTAAEAAAHLSASIKQRRIAARLGVPGPGGLADAAAGGGGAALDAAAAVAATEGHLLYAQFELSVAELQATAINLPPLPSAGGEPDRHWHSVLQPVRLGGTLKLHRIAEDYSMPQVAIWLQADPLSLSLTQQVAELLLNTLAMSAPPAAASAASAAAPAPQQQAAPAPLPPGQQAMPLMQAHSPVASGAGSTAAGRSPGAASSPGGAAAAAAGSCSAGVPVVSVDLQLSHLDLRFAAEALPSGSTAGTAAGAGHASARSGSSSSGAGGAVAAPAFEAAVGCAGASISLHSMLDGLSVNASLSRLHLHDLSPASPSLPPNQPPPVRAQPLPRLARKLAVERLSVSHSMVSAPASSPSDGSVSSAAAGGSGGGLAASAGPAGGFCSTTRLELWDVALEGYPGEAGSFLSRLQDRQATHVVATIRDTPAATHADVSASNLLIGHGLLLRLASLAQVLDEEQQQQRAAQAAAEAAAGEQDCGELAVAGGSRVLEEADVAAAAEAGGEPQPPADVLERQQAGQAGEQQTAAAAAGQQPEARSGSQSRSPIKEQQGTAGPSPAEQAGAQPTAESDTRQQQPAAPVPAPGKPVFTSVQLFDCRLVLRYQPAMHASSGAANGGGGSGHGSGSHASLNAAGAGIPAATQDFLSVHPDLLSLDVPMLQLHLPLDPPALAAAAGGAAAAAPAAEAGDDGTLPGWQASEEAAAAAVSGSSAGSSSLASESSSSSSAAGSSSSGESGTGRSWREAEASPSLGPALVQGPSVSWEKSPLSGRERLLADAHRLSVSVAAVGYSRRPMLPLLQLPSLRLTCAAQSAADGCGTAGASPVQQQLFGSPAAAAAGRSAAAGRPGEGGPAALVCYQLEATALNLGLHPTHLSMLASAVQLCQWELSVLSKDPSAEAAAGGGDAESIITVTSSGLPLPEPAQQQAQQQQQQQRAAAAAAPQQQQQAGQADGAPAGASGGAPATLGGVPGAEEAPFGAAAADGKEAEVAATGPASPVVQPGAAPPPALPPAPRWRLDASVGCIGVSLLGATPSSSCLKLEWHQLAASVSSGGAGSEALAAAVAAAVMAPRVSGRSLGSAFTPLSSLGSPGSVLGSPAAAPEGQGCELALRLSWRQLSLHVLHPRLPYTHPAFTPFAFAAALVADGRGRASQRGGSPPGGGSPRAPGLAHVRSGEALSLRGGRSGPASTGVRRNLSAGLGLAEASASEEFFDASALWLSRPSAGSSGGTRFFSLAESEFEDAASELVEGAQSPTAGHSPATAPPLPLELGSSEYDAQLLLLLHAQAGATAAAAAEGLAAASPAAGSPSGSIAGSPPAGPASAGTAGGSAQQQPSGSAQAAGQTTDVSVQLQPGRAAVTANILALRLHAAGWEEAAQCMHTYAVLAQQAQRQYQLAELARSGSPAVGPAWQAGLGSIAPPGAAGQPRGGGQPSMAHPQPQQAVGDGVRLRLSLQSVLVELLADEGEQLDGRAGGGEEAGGGDGGRGEPDGSLVPALTLQARLLLDLEQRLDGSRRLQAVVPGLLLSAGTVSAALVAADSHAPAEAAGGVPPCLALPLQDALLGLCQLDLTLMSQEQHRHLQPAATTAEGSVLLGPAHLVSVGASLARASLWVHPRNLCAVAALAGHARVVAAGLAAQLPFGEMEGGWVGADKGQLLGGQPGGEGVPPPRQLTVKVNVVKAALLLSLLSREDSGGSAAPARQQRLLAVPTPLLELAAAAVTADLHDMGAGCLEGTLRSELQVSVFSGIKMGWEPLLEPWHCRLAFAAPTAAPATCHHRLSLTSPQGLELTVTQAAMEAAALAGGALQAAAGLAGDPSHLEDRLEAAGASAAYSAAYWLLNQTGSTLEVWLADGEEASAGEGGGEGLSAADGGGSASSSAVSSPSSVGTPFASASPSAAGSTHGGRPALPRLLSGPPELVVRPGSRVVLPVVAASSAQERGLHVGTPCPLHGVSGPGGEPPAPPSQDATAASLRGSGSSSRLRLAASGSAAASGAARHAADATPSRHGSFVSHLGSDVAPPRTRPLLYFRLSEQAEVCGPLHLDRGAFHSLTGCPGVLCDMSEARHGGYTLSLHSGVQLRNTTQLALDIGVQTPMGLVMEPQPLGTLRPGGAMWLPALRAHAGLLCLRPAAAAPAAALGGSGGPESAGRGTAGAAGLSPLPAGLAAHGAASPTRHVPSAPALPAALAHAPTAPQVPLPAQAQAQGQPQAQPQLQRGGALQSAATWQPGGSSRIPSLAADSLAAAAALVAGSHAAGGPSAALPQAPRMPPSSPLLYSTTGLASPGRTSSDYLDLASRPGPGSLGWGAGHLGSGSAGAGSSAAGSGGAGPSAAPAWQHPYEWSAAVPLTALLRQAAGADGGGGRGGAHGPERSRGARQLACLPTAEGPPPVLLCMGAVRVDSGASSGAGSGASNGGLGPSGGSALPFMGGGVNGAAVLAGGAAGSWEVVLSAPLTLHNALPVPADVSVSAWGKSHRLLLQPNQHAALHAVDAAHVEHVTLRALGFHPTRPFSPAAMPPATAAEPAGGGGYGGAASGRRLHGPDTELFLQAVGHSQSSVEVFVRHSLDTATGSHSLLFGCSLWVFNCTGVPVSLRQSGGGAEAGQLFGEGGGDAAYHRILEEEVPESWLPPLDLPGKPGALPTSPNQAQQSPMHPRPAPAAAGLRAVSREGMAPGSVHGMPSALSTPTSAAPSVAGVSRGTSNVDIAGLSEILEAGSTTRSADSRQVLGLKRTVSRARGIADSMEATPAFETPSRWPSMQGGLQLHRQRLRLQIRATQCQAPSGRTYWSDPVELDALGGAAVVSVPSPLLPPTAAIPAARAAYQMSVTASQVPGSEGALALYLLPRYLLVNTLEVPIQYKQQGTQLERELAAGASRALRWADALRALRLCVRVQEAGWLWSGGFELDSPGDLFIKIRHRDRGVTMLVRVDVATSAASGVLRVTLSHHPAGFAPYRIDNCSLETLHARQYKVREQQDVLRPYCSLHYAWDEPAQPHRLVLELPGARTLGTFELDKVGQDRLLSVPTKRGEPQRQVRVLVRSEGPTRVLTVLDVQRHSLFGEEPPGPLPSLLSRVLALPRRLVGRGGKGEQRPWDKWSLPTLQGKASQQQGKGRRTAKLSGVLWEASAELAWLGVSVVGPTQEWAYFRAGGVHAELAGTAAHLVLDLEMKHLQLDNPSPWAALPVTLVVPAPVSRLTSTVAAAVDVARRPALVASLALWQRRPAGVLCVEQADLQLAPVAVYVEQQHALELAAFLTHLASSFEAAAAAAEAAARAAAAAGAPAAAGAAASAVGRGGDGEGSSRAASEASFYAAVGGGLGGTTLAQGLPAQRLPGLPAELEALLSGRGGAGTAASLAAEQKVYIDVLRIATLELTISFMPAPFQPDPGHPRLLALQRMLSLADIEDARLKLAALELRNPLMGTSALAQLLQRHYTRALLPELYKVVGSASVLGDPVRLFHHLGLGVWSFLASPAAGLVESARQRGPRQLLFGFASGTRGLFQNVVFALSNAATKGSTAARKAITALGLDRLPHARPPLDWAGGASGVRRRRLHRWDTESAAAGRSAGAAAAARGQAAAAGPGAGRAASGGAGGSSAVMFSPRDGPLEGPQAGGSPDGGVLGALLLGVAGLAAEPIRGLDEGGLLGLLGGIKRGAIGVVVLPLASLLEMFASTADSIRRAVAGGSNVGWVRPPRYVHPAQPLAPYHWAEAMGRWLLTELEAASVAGHRAAPSGQPPLRRSTSAALPGGPAAELQLRREAVGEAAPRLGSFVLCMSLAERGCFIVVSTQRVLCVCAREPMWSPVVRWGALLADLELVGRRGALISLVAQQPLRRHLVRSSSALPRALADVLKAPRPPLSFLSVECQAAGDARRLREALLGLLARVPPFATFIGHCAVILPPHAG